MITAAKHKQFVSLNEVFIKQLLETQIGEYKNKIKNEAWVWPQMLKCYKRDKTYHMKNKGVKEHNEGLKYVVFYFNISVT